MRIQIIAVILSLPIVCAIAGENLNTSQTRAMCQQAAKKFEKIELEAGHNPAKTTDFGELCVDTKKTASYWGAWINKRTKI